MFKKSHRFHGHGSVRAVYAKGQTVRGGVISLKFARRETNKPYRVAVVVSRKVHKSAVTRNRIRRRIYEAVRTTTTPPTPGSDLVFTVFDDRVASMNSEQLTDLLTSLLQNTH